MSASPPVGPSGAADPPPADVVPLEARRRSLLHVVSGLSALNIAIAAAGFITGPLQARALDSDGRGELAAILVPLGVAPALLGLALGAYATREVARGRGPGELIGSLGLVTLLVGSVGAVVGVAVAPSLAEGRNTVLAFLTIGFCLLPVSLLAGIPSSMLASTEEWRLFSIFRLTPVLIYAGGTVILYLVDELTVATSAALSVVGGFASAAVLIPFCWRHRPWTFRRSTSAAGIRFGVSYWWGGLAITLNGRLDQLLMIKLVSASELGFYAVAATIAQVPGFVAAAVGPPLLSRISGGNRTLAQRAMRSTLAAALLVAVGFGVTLPWLLPTLFGADFARSLPLAEVLLAAGVLSAGTVVASSALVADGAPGVTSWAEISALLVTAVGLALFLDEFGALAAAWTTFAAALVALVVQLRSVRKRFGGRYSEYLVVRPEDIAWVRLQLHRTQP
jgi:O-antigen/teichoic acid export membrane protein